MTLEELIDKLKVATDRERQLTQALKQFDQQIDSTKQNGFFGRIKIASKIKHLEIQLSAVLRDKKEINNQITKKLTTTNDRKTPFMEKVRLSAEAINASVTAVKIATALITPNPMPPPWEIAKPPGIEDAVQSRTLTKKNTPQSANRVRTKNSTSVRPKKQRQSKTNPEQEMILNYHKDVRKYFYKTKDISQALAMADKNLLDKLKKNSTGEHTPIVRDAVHKKFGEPIAKKFEDIRKQELEKRKPQDLIQNQNLQKDKNKTF